MHSLHHGVLYIQNDTTSYGTRLMHSLSFPVTNAMPLLPDFHDTHKWPTALSAELTEQKSPKSENKCADYGYTYIH